MAPMSSEFRARGRTEPTDMQKTARVAMIRSRQRTARLGTLGFPNPNAVGPSDNVAFNEDGGETWQRPEPNPLYREAYTADLKKLEANAIKEELLEEKLKSLNQDIAAAETGGEMLSTDDSTVKEAIDTYNELLKTRNQLQTTGGKIASGIETQYRSNTWPFGLGGVGGALVVLGALYYFRTRPKRSGGPRYGATTDRLAIFGNF